MKDNNLGKSIMNKKVLIILGLLTTGCASDWSDSHYWMDGATNNYVVFKQELDKSSYLDCPEKTPEVEFDYTAERVSLIGVRDNILITDSNKSTKWKTAYFKDKIIHLRKYCGQNNNIASPSCQNDYLEEVVHYCLANESQAKVQKGMWRWVDEVITPEYQYLLSLEDNTHMNGIINNRKDK